MYKNKKNGAIGTVITIAVLVILVFATNVDIKNFSKTENAFSKLVMPFQNGLAYLKNKIAKNDSFFKNIEILEEENKELKEQNKELQKQIDEIQIIKAENSVLREYANLTEQYSEYETIPGYIINRDISNLSSNFVINIGTKNGINVNMAVIGPDGLIGYIVSATSYTAKVQPIINVSSSVSGVLSSSRKNVIVKGEMNTNTNLKVTFLQADEEFIIGDIVETSGLGGIYPKGIKIGTITKIIQTKNVTEKYAILETSTDFSNLEYVLVIKNND